MYIRLFHIFVLSVVSIFHSHAQCELELVEFNFDTGYIEVVIGEDCPSTDAVGLCIHLGVDTFYCGDWGSAFFHPTMYFLDFQAQFWVSPTTGIAYPGDTIILDAAVNTVGSSSNPYTVWECFQQHENYDPSCDGGWVAIWQVNGSNGNPGPNDAPWESVNNSSGDWIDSTFESTAIALSNGCCPPADTIYLTETDTVVEYIYLDGDTIYLTETDTTYILEIDTLIEYVEVITVDTILEIEVIIDTIVEYVDVLVVDTLYLYVHDTTYIYITDTVSVTYVETIYTTIQLDCDTGDPCEDGFVDTECRVYIPNSVTPDNDGINDAWGAVTDTDCWFTWELSVYNRWGERLWVSDAPGGRWNMGITHYIQDGVYTWSLRASSYDAQVIDRQGHFTVIR
jgi:hypothetical protein